MTETKYVTLNVAEDVVHLLPDGLVSEIRRLRVETGELKRRIIRLQRNAFTDEEWTELLGHKAERFLDFARKRGVDAMGRVIETDEPSTRQEKGG